jgi:GGDEF domain-containing protein
MQAPIARRINDVLGEPMTIAGRQMVVTASLGMAMFPRDGSDAMTLLRHADTRCITRRNRAATTGRCTTAA